MRYNHEETDCLGGMRRYFDEYGEVPTKRDYSNTYILPSYSTIEKQIGSWNKAKEKSGVLGLKENSRGNSGCEVRKDYFKTLNKENSYWLGFLYGDGTINDRGGHYRTSLFLSEKDKNHILKYKQTIRSGAKIVEDGDTTGFGVGDGEFNQNLLNKGFTPTKGSDGSLPEIDNWNLKRAFIRGLSDADGYYGEERFTIVDNNSKRLDALSDWIPFEYQIIEYDREGQSWSELRIGKSKLEPLYHWLFPRGSETYPTLKRKRKDVLKFLNGSF